MLKLLYCPRCQWVPWQMGPLHRKQGDICGLPTRGCWMWLWKNFIPRSISSLSTQITVLAEPQQSGASLTSISNAAFHSSSSLSQHFSPSPAPPTYTHARTRTHASGAPDLSQEEDLLIKSLTLRPTRATLAVQTEMLLGGPCSKAIIRCLCFLVATTTVMDGTFLQIRMIDAKRSLWNKHLLSITPIECSDTLPVAFYEAARNSAISQRGMQETRASWKLLSPRWGIHYRQWPSEWLLSFVSSGNRTGSRGY